MKIHEYYYNDSNKILYVEFSTKEDGDSFYRVLEITYSDIAYYSTELITEDDIMDMDEDFLKDILFGYFNENDLPEEKSL